MRMQTWRLAQTLSGGDAGRLADQLAQFDQSVQLLRSGDPARPLFLPKDQRTRQRFEDVQRGWLQLRQLWSAAPLPAARPAAAQAEAYVARIDAFVSAIEQQLSRLTVVLNAFQFLMVALAIGSAVALLCSAHLFVFNPLARLQAGLSQVGEGDLAARVERSSTRPACRRISTSTATACRWLPTCRFHVQHILRKLGLGSRVQAAVYAAGRV